MNDIYSIDLTDKTIVLKGEGDEASRTYIATGGFGCSPGSDGKVFVTNIATGESSYTRRGAVEKLAEKQVALADLPACFSHTMTNESERPGMVALCFSNGTKLWVTRDGLKHFARDLVSIALR